MRTRGGGRFLLYFYGHPLRTTHIMRMAIDVPVGALQGVEQWSTPIGKYSCGSLQLDERSSIGRAPDVTYMVARLEVENSSLKNPPQVIALPAGCASHLLSVIISLVLVFFCLMFIFYHDW